MQAVQNAVQNSITQLRNGGVQANAIKFDDQPKQYALQARTPQELAQSAGQAAEERHVDPMAAFAQLNDPAQQLGGLAAAAMQPELTLPAFENRPTTLDAQPIQPAPAQDAAETGWLM